MRDDVCKLTVGGRIFFLNKRTSCSLKAIKPTTRITLHTASTITAESRETNQWWSNQSHRCCGCRVVEKRPACEIEWATEHILVGGYEISWKTMKILEGIFASRLIHHRHAPSGDPSRSRFTPSPCYGRLLHKTINHPSFISSTETHSYILGLSPSQPAIHQQATSCQLAATAICTMVIGDVDTTTSRDMNHRIIRESLISGSRSSQPSMHHIRTSIGPHTPW
jgi:hypothetical protein